METHHDYILRLRRRSLDCDGRGLTAWELAALDAGNIG